MHSFSSVSTSAFRLSFTTILHTTQGLVTKALPEEWAVVNASKQEDRHPGRSVARALAPNYPSLPKHRQRPADDAAAHAHAMMVNLLQSHTKSERTDTTSGDVHSTRTDTHPSVTVPSTPIKSELSVGKSSTEVPRTAAAVPSRKRKSRSAVLERLKRATAPKKAKAKATTRASTTLTTVTSTDVKVENGPKKTANSSKLVPSEPEPFSIFHYNENENEMPAPIPCVVARMKLYLTELFRSHAPEKIKNIDRLGLLLSKPPKEGGLTLRKLSSRMRSVYGVDMEGDMTRELRENAAIFLTAHAGAGKVGRVRW